MSTFLPHLDVLPAAQKALWLRLVETPAEFALYGGTAVALRLGHRSSIDFDLFTSARLAADRLLAEVGYLRHCEVLQRAPDTLTVSIAIEGTRVKVSYLGGLTMGRVGRPDRAEPDSVPVASGLDLLATKLKVLLERTQEKDYLDIAHLLMSGITLRQGLGAAVALYGNQFPPMDCVKALAYFEGGDVGNLPDELKRFLIEQTDDWDLGVDEVPVLGDSLAEDPTG